MITIEIELQAARRIADSEFTGLQLIFAGNHKLLYDHVNNKSVFWEQFPTMKSFLWREQ